MAFKNDPGHGALFRNQYKEKENQPDHTGGACCPLCDGDLDLSAWVKDGRNGKFFSIALKEKYVKPGSEPVPQPSPEEFDDDIPF